MEFDKQEIMILKALIKDPRMSDNQIGKLTKVPIRTVSRKRNKLEKEEKLFYHVSTNHQISAKVRHLYLIKFRMGITKKKLLLEIKQEPSVKTLFTEMIYNSQFAEIDGHTAILMEVEGKTDNGISENFNGKILPSMLENHGSDSIEEIKTIRLSGKIRVFHNYLPSINMKHAKLDPNWPINSIYIG